MKDYNDIFEPTHRDNEPTWSFDGFTLGVLSLMVIFGILLALNIAS